MFLHVFESVILNEQVSSFKIEHEDPQLLYRDIFSTLLANELVEAGDMVIFTKGDLSGVKGSTNSMMIIQVTASD